MAEFDIACAPHISNAGNAQMLFSGRAAAPGGWWGFPGPDRRGEIMSISSPRSFMSAPGLIILTRKNHLLILALPKGRFKIIHSRGESYDGQKVCGAPE
jgi:hypothetical protein